jgi:Na+/glutamate symporter
MKSAFGGTQEEVGWGTALVLALVSLPLMAAAVLIVRTFLIPLVVVGVVVMALLALFVPPRYRAWVNESWRTPRR